ncbi:hypothetical protein RHMOL_Rhmol04G0371900 [Rhododendron molle]|uniref:Uncharacterized protein n=1 Tax=Rhododendron molle TaxID=49168 RepID=A0ACC0P809_RHOML|nr:hypothetical protein RHMOL_Rhmol04G0371900 [Rhododendron molle]
MEAPNYRRGNLLSPPPHSSFNLLPKTDCVQKKKKTEDQLIFERKRFRKQKPKSKNLRFVRSTPLVFETNKALSILTKSGKCSAALSEFNNELQSQALGG